MELRHYVVLLKRLGLLALIYTLCRIIFFVFNYQNFQQAPWSTLAEAFVLGFRFDLAALCLINVLFILFSVIPVKNISTFAYQKFLKVLFLICNIPFILLNLTDVEYYKFKGTRTTLSILGIMDDVKDQAFQLAGNYWYILLLAALIIFLLIRFYPEMSVTRSSAQSLSAWKSYPAMLLIISVGFFSFRGFGLKPLRPTDAFVLSPNQLGNLVLNTPFIFLLSADMKGVNRADYFDSMEAAASWIKKTPVKESAPERKDNVVIIILESFASEYIGAGNNYKGYTPFLDSLAGEGLFFHKNFANGRQSIEALPSILASIPSLMNEPYSTSMYQTNRLIGLGTVLGQKGYHTSFFHGGKNGTMGFDSFSKNAGFTSYYGLNEYSEPDRDFDGNWGIFDEPYLQYVALKLNEFKKPFVSGVFTLSSHQPYTIPEIHKGKFPKGELEVHESIGYADYSLRRFFQTASRQDWYKNTLFVITADHTQMNSREEYQNVIGQYNVPLIFFHPSRKISADTSEVTQHADIFPSILDYLNISFSDFLPFGRSVFDTTYAGEAINYSNGSYRLIAKDYFLEFTPQNGSRLYDFNSDKAQKNPIPDKEKLRLEKEQKLKAYIQFYNNGLIDNNWYESGSR